MAALCAIAPHPYGMPRATRSFSSSAGHRVRNTISYRSDGIRHRLQDSEGNKLMIWDQMGYSGYVDLVQERTE